MECRVVAIPRHILDDRVAWAAVQAAIEGIVCARVTWLIDFAEAMAADSEIRGDSRAGLIGSGKLPAGGIEPGAFGGGEI